MKRFHMVKGAHGGYIIIKESWMHFIEEVNRVRLTSFFSGF